VDLPERAEGAVKSNTGLASFAKVAFGYGGRADVPRVLFQQKTPVISGVFCL